MKKWCLALALTVWPAQSKTAVKPHARVAGSQARPSISDEEIERRFREKAAASAIASEDFRIYAQGGVATIEGHSGSVQHKALATRLAKSAGAVMVVNRIRVDAEARRQAAESLPKGRRRQQRRRGETRDQARGEDRGERYH